MELSPGYRLKSSDVDVSVVICSFRNPERLHKTLISLNSCPLPPRLKWEIIVVNNDGTRQTNNVARANRSLPVRCITERRVGLSHARNAGLKRASGEWIIFTDDDTEPEPMWLMTYWHAFTKRGDNYYFGGPVESNFEDDRYDRELVALAPSCIKGLNWGPKPRLITENEYFIGANWACARKALEIAGGFDPSLGLVATSSQLSTGEESDLMYRLRQLGFRGFYLPAAKVRHFVPKEKYTLRHITKKLEANIRSCRHMRNQSPRKIIRNLAASSVKWTIAKIRGQSGFQEYLWFRSAVAEFKRNLNDGNIYAKKDQHN